MTVYACNVLSSDGRVYVSSVVDCFALCGNTVSLMLASCMREQPCCGRCPGAVLPAACRCRGQPRDAKGVLQRCCLLLLAHVAVSQSTPGGTHLTPVLSQTGVKVVSASYGRDGTASTPEKNAITALGTAGILFVGTAGNGACCRSGCWLPLPPPPPLLLLLLLRLEKTAGVVCAASARQHMISEYSPASRSRDRQRGCCTRQQRRCNTDSQQRLPAACHLASPRLASLAAPDPAPLLCPSCPPPCVAPLQ